MRSEPAWRVFVDRTNSVALAGSCRVNISCVGLTTSGFLFFVYSLILFYVLAFIRLPLVLIVWVGSCDWRRVKEFIFRPIYISRYFLHQLLFVNIMYGIRILDFFFIVSELLVWFVQVYTVLVTSELHCLMTFTKWMKLFFFYSWFICLLILSNCLILSLYFSSFLWFLFIHLLISISNPIIQFL